MSSIPAEGTASLASSTAFHSAQPNSEAAF